MRVWSDFTHSAVPALALLIDPETAEFDVVTPTGDTMELPDDDFAPGLQAPDGRVYCLGFEYRDAAAFAESCRHITDMNTSPVFCADLV